MWLLKNKSETQRILCFSDLSVSGNLPDAVICQNYMRIDLKNRSRQETESCGSREKDVLKKGQLLGVKRPVCGYSRSKANKKPSV